MLAESTATSFLVSFIPIAIFLVILGVFVWQSVRKIINPMKTLREFTNPVLAGLVQSFLKDHEIDAVLLDQGASAWTAGRILVPVRLVVPSGQADVAENLLKQFEENGEEKKC